MINEEQKQLFYPKSLEELNTYFDNIEHRRIEAEREKKETTIGTTEKGEKTSRNKSAGGKRKNRKR